MASVACFNNRAHIIGVSVNDTTAEMRIVTLSVTANSRNNRPDDVTHEQQRDQHGNQGDRERKDRKADLLRALQRGLQRRLARSM